MKTEIDFRSFGKIKSQVSRKVRKCTGLDADTPCGIDILPGESYARQRVLNDDRFVDGIMNRVMCPECTIKAQEQQQAKFCSACEEAAAKDKAGVVSKNRAHLSGDGYKQMHRRRRDLGEVSACLKFVTTTMLP